MGLTKCTDCGKEISTSADSCPFCGKPMSSIIKCPNCKSSDVEKISTSSKVGSAVLFGVFAMGKINKSYECKKCGYKW